MLSTDAILVQAQEAKKTLGTASTEVKNHALRHGRCPGGRL